MSRPGAAIAAPAVCCLLGMAALLYGTGQGIGTSPDSVVYIGAARNALAGYGFTLPFGPALNAPLTHHAPLYAALLAFGGALGADVLSGARWLNVMLFGATILLTGLAVYRPRPAPWWPAALASWLVLASTAMIGIHAFAWSEPIFIFLGYTGLLVLAAYLARPRPWLLTLAAALTALAFLARYAGLPFVGAGALGILLSGQQARGHRVRDALIFCLAGGLPMLLWTIRNLFSVGTATNRAIAFHPIGRDHLWQAIYIVSDWLYVPAATPGVIRAALCLAALLAMAALLAYHWRRRGQPSFAALTGLFALVYVLFLVFSISFVDAHTPLDARIMSPLYPALVLVGTQGVADEWRALGHSLAIRTGLAVAACAFLAIASAGSLRWLRDSRGSGLGFSSSAWRESALLAEVGQLPGDVTLYSNAPEPVYLLTGRPVLALPRQVSATSGLANESFSADLIVIKTRLHGAPGALVYFRALAQRALPAEAELVQALSLEPMAQFEEGALYIAGGGSP